MITLRPWLDRLLLATLVVTTWHKLHWSPGAGDVTLEDILATAFVALFVVDRCLRRDARMHRVALGLLLAMAVLEAVYLGGYFALENSEQLSQYAKGMVKFALHFGFLVCGTQYVIDRGERLLRRTIGAFVAGLALNCAYGVAQLAAQVGAGVNLDKRLIGPLTFGQGSLGGINVYGQTTAVESGSYVSLGVYRVNALALDPNHLGIMLCVPILLLLPFALRAGVRSRRGLVLAGLLAFFVFVEVLTLSRSGLLGLACGLLVLAWPLRRQLLQPRFLAPLAGALGLLAVALASSSYVRQVFRSRVTLSDNSAKVHFQFFDLVQPVLDAHPVFGLGLNTFSALLPVPHRQDELGPALLLHRAARRDRSRRRVRVRRLPGLGRNPPGRDPARVAGARAPRRSGSGRVAGAGDRPLGRADGHARREHLLPDDAVLLLLRPRPDRRRRVGAGGRSGAARRGMTDVSVVIVSYESKPLLARCLTALAADAARAATCEVIVVDQASTDGTAAWLASEHPEVRLVALPENVGFGAGNNRGAALASGRWLLLLNSDAFVRPGAIDELVRFAESRPAAGVVGPRLSWPDGRLQRSCRRFPTVFRIATEFLYLRKIAPRSRILNGFYYGEFAHDEAWRVDWVTGACVLVRRELFEQLGGFDEAFFLYSEEVDLIYRARQLGAETWYDPAAEVVHEWGGTAGRSSALTLEEQARGHVRYLDKHASRATAKRARGVLLAGLRLRARRSGAYREAARWLAARPVEQLLAETRPQRQGPQ